MTVDLKMPSYEKAEITDLTVALEPMQDTSGGDPSPSNICPISGWDEVKIWDDPAFDFGLIDTIITKKE